MLGSTTLHGWIESAWYLQTQEPRDGKAVVTIDREFRGAGLYDKIDVTMTMGNQGDPTYSTEVGVHNPDGSTANYEQEVMDILATSHDLMSKTEMSRKMGLSRYQLEKVVDALFKDGQLFRKGERYGITKHEDKQAA